MEKISNKFNVRNVMIIVILILIVSIILLSCKGNSTPIDVVKNGTFDDYPDVLIGKAFDSFFANPKWLSFISEDNEQIVEFSGGAMLGEENVTVEMQFEVKNNSFEAFWLGVNGEDQPNEELFDWIDTACQEYQKSNSSKNTTSSSGNKPTSECSLYVFFALQSYASLPTLACDYYIKNHPEEYDAEIKIEGLGSWENGKKLKEAMRYFANNPKNAYDNIMRKYESDYSLKYAINGVFDDNRVMKLLQEAAYVIADCLP
jgi:hypothetical protein